MVAEVTHAGLRQLAERVEELANVLPYSLIPDAYDNVVRNTILSGNGTQSHCSVTDKRLDFSNVVDEMCPVTGGPNTHDRDADA